MNQIKYLVFETIKVLEYMHDIAQRKKEYKAIFQYFYGRLTHINLLYSNEIFTTFITSKYR